MLEEPFPGVLVLSLHQGVRHEDREAIGVNKVGSENDGLGLGLHVRAIEAHDWTNPLENGFEGSEKNEEACKAVFIIST